MDKGILYLACTAVVLGLGAAGFVSVNNKLNKLQPTVVVEKVVVSPTTAPTATPSAFLRSTVKTVVPVTTKAK